MKKLNLFLAAVLSVALTGIGAAPANAVDNSILPSNANGTDNSGIVATMCPKGLNLSIPTKASSDPDATMFQGEYLGYKWLVQIEDYLIAEVPANNGMAYANLMTVQAFNGNDDLSTFTPGETVTISFSARAIVEGYTEVDSDVFTIDYTVVDPTDFEEGSGTEADPFVIKTAADLEKLRCADGAHYELANDIDLQNNPLVPFGAGSSSEYVGNGEYVRDPFASLVLNGNGHTISNLKIDYLGGYAGMFGRIRNSIIENLVIDGAEVWGQERTGVLFGYSTNSTFRNIEIKNAQLHAVGYSAGLLGGVNDYNSTFENISVQGTITGHMTAFFDSSNNLLNTERGTNLGGYLGYDDADGSIHENIDVDVVINALYEAGYGLDEYTSIGRTGGFMSEIGEGASVNQVSVKAEFNLSSTLSVNDIGCFAGDSEELLFKNLDIDCEMNITANSAEDISGVVGEADSATYMNVDAVSAINLEVSESARRVTGFQSELYDSSASNSTIRSDISIVHTGESGYISNVGIGCGKNDEGNFDNVRSSGSISLTSTQSNTVEVDNIGGFCGRNEQNANYSNVESDVEIEIGEFGGDVQRIGGFVGDDNTYNHIIPLNDIVVKGSITLSSVGDSIGGLVGQTDGLNAGRVLIAVAINQVNGSTNVGPVVGSYRVRDFLPEDASLQPINRTRVKVLYWDSTVETMAAQAGYHGNSATTEQLKSSTWLAQAGYDISDRWVANGSYPTLKNVYSRNAAVDFSKFGQANENLKIAFTKMRVSTQRTFFINLVTKYAGKKVRIEFLRAGAKYKTLKKGLLDINGDKRFKSKVAIAAGDVIRVKVGKKVVARYVVK